MPTLPASATLTRTSGWESLKPSPRSEEPDVAKQHRVGSGPYLVGPSLRPAQLGGPAEHVRDLGRGKQVRRLDVDHPVASARVEQEVGHVSPQHRPVAAGQPERLTRHPPHLRVEVDQPETVPLKQAFVAHQRLRGRQPQPPRIFPLTPGRREGPNRAATDNIRPGNLPQIRRHRLAVSVTSSDTSSKSLVSRSALMTALARPGSRPPGSGARAGPEDLGSGATGRIQGPELTEVPHTSPDRLISGHSARTEAARASEGPSVEGLSGRDRQLTAACPQSG